MIEGLTYKLNIGLLTLATIVVGGAFKGGSASAVTAQSSLGIQFSFNSSLSMTLSSFDLVVPNITSGNYNNSNTITINVATNNNYGYTLMATVGDDTKQAFANNSLVNTSSSSATISSLLPTDRLTIANFGDGKWGYTVAPTVNSSAVYSGISHDTDTVINATKNTAGLPPSETNYPGGSTTNFTIGVKAGTAQGAGTYTNVINFKTVVNVDTDFGVIYMQDLGRLSGEEEQKMLLYMPEGNIYQLADNRDDKMYNVAKMKDGKLWMVENLALDPATLKTGVTLGDDNTNISAGISFTLPASSTTGFDTTTGYTTAAINTESKDVSVPIAGSETETGKVGVYYNYCAATAGTMCSASTSSEASYDICPWGWEIPSASELESLVHAYSSGEEFVSAFKVAFAGLFMDGEPSAQGTMDGFWSKTVGMISKYKTDYTGREGLVVVDLVRSGVPEEYIEQAGTTISVSTNAYVNSDLNRSSGHSIRCVYRGAPIELM